MPLSAAPYYDDVCPDCIAGTAYWANTSDGKKIRLAVWGREGAKGTVLLFPGRTEYVEKYSDTATVLAQHGYCTIAIDWRGQGLSERLLDNPMIGHVVEFLDYQKDVAALMDAVQELALPAPRYMLAHSMGGAIGLRALMQGLEVKAATFSAPMWGIQIAPHMRIPARVMGMIMPRIGKGTDNPPGTTLDSYVLNTPAEGNMLTTDPAMFSWMQEQIRSYPALGLGGPSYIWLRESLNETDRLAKCPSPDVPCLTFMGTNERIVKTAAIDKRMRKWPNGKLVLVEGAEHEILMEKPDMRQTAFDQIAHFFDKHA